MIRLDGKALRHMNFKAVWWFIPVIFAQLVVFYGINLLLPEFRLYSLYGLRNVFIIITISITLVAMSSVLFHFDRRTPYATFAASMPYSKSGALLSKWMVGAYNIVSAFFMAYVVLNIILINQSLWKIFFIDLTLWTVSTTLMYLFIFSFIIMIQSASNSTWFGTLITIMITALPIIIMALVFSQYIRYYPQSMFQSEIPVFPGFLPKNFIEKTIHTAFIWILGLFGMAASYYNFYPYIYSSYSEEYYSNDTNLYGKYLGDPFYSSGTFTFIRCTAFIILTIVFLYVSTHLYRRTMAGKTGSIAGIVWIEKLFKLIISFYISFLVLASIALIKGFVRLDWIVEFGLVVPVLLYKFAFSPKKPGKKIMNRFTKSLKEGR